MKGKLSGWGDYDKGRAPRPPKPKTPPQKAKPKIIKAPKYGKVK
jgi:hypothetical protein